MFATLLILSATLTPAKTWTLTKNGKSNYDIVVAPGGSPSMLHGAEEIQRYIQAVSGVKLRILRPEAGWTLNHKSIVIADDSVVSTRGNRKPLEPEEYRIVTTPNGVLITGDHQRGALYGCYTFLEDVLGVRWFNTRVTRVPKRKTIQFGSLNIQSKPAFEYREPFFTESFDGDWAARNKVNGNAQRLDEAHGGKVSYGRFVHTFNELVPPETYFDTHPEYFSMIDGKRMKGYYQLCLSNGDVVRIAAQSVEAWIRENPEATIFSVSQNDTYYNCQCPECRKVEEEEGAASGPLIRFVNKVAELIGKKHPKILIDTLAYQWSEKPPLKVRPRSNVRIRIAPIGACFSHPLDGCPENAMPLQNLLAWSKVTKNIYIWHYTTNFANYLQPLPNLDEIVGDVRLFQKLGVVGVFDEGDYAEGGGGDLAGLKSYVLAKLMWSPKADAVKVVDEYLSGVYGKAAPSIKKWIDLTHASSRAMRSHARIYDPPTAPYLDDAVLQAGSVVFAEAERSVANDPPALDEVERLKLGLEYVQLHRAKLGSPEFAALPRSVAAKIKKFGISSVREGEPVSEFLKRIGQ